MCMQIPTTEKSANIYLPINDGKDHINIYSRGRTILGKQLSNFAHLPFKHPKYGEFASLEAFYYWLSTGKCHEELRSLYGFNAKRDGSKLQKVPCEDFHDKIVEAIIYKIEQNPDLAEMLRVSTLPLAHYYWYGTVDNCKVIALEDHSYMVDALEEIRRELQKKYVFEL